MTGALAALGLAAIAHTVEPQSGLESWSWKGSGIDITLNQRLPDQTRAYFLGRGFSAAQAEEIAAACVFQAIIRNQSATAQLSLNLAEWRVTAGDSAKPVRLEAEWQTRWQQQEVDTAARVAFRWSLFPATQQFEPGDWNMGMVTMGLPHDTRFALALRWQSGKEAHEFRFPELRCAPDRHLAPEQIP